MTFNTQKGHNTVSTPEPTQWWELSNLFVYDAGTNGPAYMWVSTGWIPVILLLVLAIGMYIQHRRRINDDQEYHKDTG